MKEYANKYLQPFKSPSNNFIQIRLMTEKPMVSKCECKQTITSHEQFENTKEVIRSNQK